MVRVKTGHETQGYYLWSFHCLEVSLYLWQFRTKSVETALNVRRGRLKGGYLRVEEAFHKEKRPKIRE